MKNSSGTFDSQNQEFVLLSNNSKNTGTVNSLPSSRVNINIPNKDIKFIESEFMIKNNGRKKSRFYSIRSKTLLGTIDEKRRQDFKHSIRKLD